MSVENLLTTRAAAEFLGISPQTLVAHSKSGAIQASFVCRRWRYRIEDLQKFVDANRRSS
jgi:excisionase family DNA binding protein